MIGRRAFAFVAAYVLWLGCVTAQQAAGDGEAEGAATTEPVLTSQQRVLGLVTIYAGAKQHFAWFEQVGDLNWDQAFMDFLPRVQKQQSLSEYYRVLKRFTALLKDGHTSVYLPRALQVGLDRLPLTLDYLEDKWVVIERFPTPEIVQADVPVGSVLSAIDGLPASKYFQRELFPHVSAGNERALWWKVNGRLFFPAGAEVRLKLQYPGGAVHDRRLRANSRSVEWTPALQQRYLLPWGRPPAFESKTLADGVLYVRYGRCDSTCARAFSRLVGSLPEPGPKALILDLRGNPGGSTPSRAARELTDKPLTWYRWRTRWSSSYHEAQMQQMKPSERAAYLKRRGFPEGFAPGWFTPSAGGDNRLLPAEKHYAGPVVILTNVATGSAAEDLTVLLHGNGRATVVGEPTSGSTGQPILLALPGGGRVRICTGQAHYPDGREFVGPGIRPDVPVNRTIKGVTEGRDEILQAALKLIRSRPE